MFKLLTIFAMGLLGFAGYLTWESIQNRRDIQELVQEQQVWGKVEPFSFTERDGDPLTLDYLQGKVWIAAFIFTRCPSVCPRITAEMKRLQDDFAEQNFYLASFTVDPDYDTPEVLTKYANTFGAHQQKWLFLTGPKNQIHDYIRKSFLLSVGESEGAQDDSVLNMDIAHSSRLVLIDQTGQIKGYFDSNDPAAMQQLRKQAAKLLAK